MAKITPKTLLKKSSKVIDLDDVDISKYNFSIEDLDDEKSKSHALLKKILDSSSACQVSDAYSSVSGRNGVMFMVRYSLQRPIQMIGELP